jgi:hypothetical protein
LFDFIHVEVGNRLFMVPLRVAWRDREKFVPVLERLLRPALDDEIEGLGKSDPVSLLVLDRRAERFTQDFILPRPTPTSTRPPLTMSSIAAISAIRTG